jgi:hypothetical protein
VVVAAVTATGIQRAWRDRAAASPADLAVVFAAIVTAALLLIPKNVAYLYRLLLMAPVPAAVIAATSPFQASESAGPSDSNLRPLHVGRYFDLLEFMPPRS